jgi:hypothetical protein
MTLADLSSGDESPAYDGPVAEWVICGGVIAGEKSAAYNGRQGAGG